MNPTAKSMVIKAQDCLDMAKKCLDEESQHDIAGFNLAQASEYFMKALIAEFNLKFPEGAENDLDALMETLEEGNFAKISSHADLLDLAPYNTLRPQVRPNERLNLNEYFFKVQDLKELVRKSTV